MELFTLTLILLLPIFILLVIDYYSHNNRVGRFIDKIPGPTFFPIIGNGLDIFISLELLWHFFRINARKFYPIYKFWLFNRPIVNVYHPDDLEILLSSPKNIEKSLFYDLLHPWLNQGLLTSTGEKWHKRRKILTPTFHFNILSEFVGSFVEHTNQLVAQLRAEAESGQVVKELLSMFSVLTLSIICDTAMGTTIQSDNEKQTKYRNAIYKMGELFFYRGRRPWLKSKAIFALTSKGKEQADTLATLHGFTSKIIEERKQYHDETGGKYLNQFSTEATETTDVDVELKNRKRLAFLDLLIAASRGGFGINDHGIREEVDTFVFEGHDTTAMAFLFTTLLLAEHKDVQEKCRQEVAEVFKSCGEKLTIKEVQKLNYLDRCIREVLRLYPSVPAVSRKITHDIQLKHCFLAKGSIAHIHIFDTHRDSNFWPRPNIFDPDRFLPEQSKGRHPFAYVPFSAGPRNCIGQRFAMLELKTVVAGLLDNFYLEPMEVAANVRFLTDLVLRCNHEIHVKFVPIVK